MSVVAFGKNLGGRDVLIIGIEPENIRRMQDGEPMFFSKESHPGFPFDLNVAICVGTPDDLAEKLKASNPSAAVHDLREGRRR